MARSKATHAHVVFEVAGRGDFPIDMLRYDMAAPFTGADVASIMTPKYVERAEPNGPGFPSRVQIERVVKVIRFYPVGGKAEPEAARWASFGWRVISIEGRSL